MNTLLRVLFILFVADFLSKLYYLSKSEVPKRTLGVLAFDTLLTAVLAAWISVFIFGGA